MKVGRNKGSDGKTLNEIGPMVDILIFSALHIENISCSLENTLEGTERRTILFGLLCGGKVRNGCMQYSRSPSMFPLHLLSLLYVLRSQTCVNNCRTPSLPLQFLV